MLSKQMTGRRELGVRGGSFLPHEPASLFLLTPFLTPDDPPHVLMYVRYLLLLRNAPPPRYRHVPNVVKPAGIASILSVRNEVTCKPARALTSCLFTFCTSGILLRHLPV